MLDAHWIFFDIGSTLVDETVAVKSRNRTVIPLLRKLGIRTSAKRLWGLHFIGGRKGVKNPFNYALETVGCSGNDIKWIRIRAPYDSRKERLYPGVKKLLQGLSRHYRLGIIANQSRGLAKRLQRLGIAGYLKVIVGSADVGFDKPDPRIFRLALERARARAGECVMVGDIPNKDILPANRLGLTTVQVRQGFHTRYRPTSTLERPNYRIRRIAQFRSLTAGNAPEIRAMR